MNRIRIACFVLMFTAAGLAGALVTLIAQQSDNPAQAELVVSTQGFVVLTAKIGNGEDGLYLLNSSTGDLIIYGTDGRSRMEPLAAENFAGGGGGGNRRGGGR